MFYAYILKSDVNGDIYVGSTENVSQRLLRHNNGKVLSTKGYRPWKLIEARACQSRSEAVKIERFLKSGQQKEILRRKYGHVVKIANTAVCKTAIRGCKSHHGLQA